MAYKVILTDLDETLFTPEKKVSAFSKQILNECKAQGILVGFATSRGINDIRGVVREVGPDVVISSGGAYVECRGEVIYESGFTAAEIRAMIEKSRELCGEEVEITVDTRHTLYWNSEESIRNFYNGTGSVTYSNYHDYDEVAFKISVMTYDEVIANQIAGCVEGCKSMKFSDIPWYTFSKAGAMKESGVEKLAAHLGIGYEDIIAFGDDYSDIGMLKCCGTGVAMENAILPAKEAADAIAPANTQDGVAVYLKEHVLG